MVADGEYLLRAFHPMVPIRVAPAHIDSGMTKLGRRLKRAKWSAPTSPIRRAGTDELQQGADHPHGDEEYRQRPAGLQRAESKRDNGPGAQGDELHPEVTRVELDAHCGVPQGLAPRTSPGRAVAWPAENHQLSPRGHEARAD